MERKIGHGTGSSVADPVFHCFPFIGVAICKETINKSSYYTGLGTGHCADGSCLNEKGSKEINTCREEK